MRAWSLLLGPSAFCLLAGFIGLGCSSLFLCSSLEDDVKAGRVGLLASAVLLSGGTLSLSGALVVAVRSRRRRLWSCFLRWTVVAGIMVIPTAVLFGPRGEFHHHIGFGFPFFYMVWNGEDPAPGSFQVVEGYQVWLNLLSFGLLYVVWMLILAMTISKVRPARQN